MVLSNVTNTNNNSHQWTGKIFPTLKLKKIIKQGPKKGLLINSINVK
jgi:hypothetical protein